MMTAMKHKALAEGMASVPRGSIGMAVSAIIHGTLAEAERRIGQKQRPIILI